MSRRTIGAYHFMFIRNNWVLKNMTDNTIIGDYTANRAESLKRAWADLADDVTNSGFGAADCVFDDEPSRMILVDFSSLNVNIKLVKNLDYENYTLEWDDGVANTWTENYRDIAVAFARLALLLKCSQDNTTMCDQQVFEQTVEGFLIASE